MNRLDTCTENVIKIVHVPFRGTTLMLSKSWIPDGTAKASAAPREGFEE